jgi:hypothetical protein
MIVEGKDSRTVKLRNNAVMLGNLYNVTLEEMVPKDTGLELFVINTLKLERREEKEGGVRMVLVMERKSSREMLTTYVPSTMLMAITFATIFFEFSDAVAALMTIILVMQGIFTSKIETLPPSSDIKMLDIWLIGCFIYPFIEMILRTIIEKLKNDENQVAGNKKETAADVKEGGKEKEAMPESRQPSGRRVSPLVIQVEPREGKAAGPATPPVAAGEGGKGEGARGLNGCTFLSVLKIIGE